MYAFMGPEAGQDASGMTGQRGEVASGPLLIMSTVLMGIFVQLRELLQG